MSGLVPMIGTPLASRSSASLSGVWPPYCTITPSRLFLVDDLQHVFQRQRLEVQAVGGVVVGRHGLGVAVDHDGLVAVLAHRERGVHAAVVELDALADAVGPAAEHHDLLLVGRLGLALVLVGRVHVGGVGRELGRAGVDALVDRAHAQGAALLADRGVGGLRAGAPGGGRRSPSSSARAACRVSMSSSDLVSSSSSIFTISSICTRNHGSILVSANTSSTLRPMREGIADVPDALGAGLAQFLLEHFAVLRLLVQAVDADFQAAQRLLERFLEGAAHRHHLADRLHLRRQARIGLREFLEREARDLGDHVVDAGLEATRAWRRR